MSNEATCAACGSTYRGAAIGGLEVDQWERREGVLHELRWCICQRARKGRDDATGNVAIARPDLAANVALVSSGYRGALYPSTFIRATPTMCVALDGTKFKNGRRIGATGYSLPTIPPDELARLEAWAASQPRGKASR